jgi:nickel superoxide dismutase
MLGSKRGIGIYLFLPFGMLFIMVFFVNRGFSHCEVPCGIYDDPMRLEMIAEDIQTVEKAMKQIVLLSGAREKNYNQLVRWIMNKDEHATRIQDTVWRYFMTQRIKPVAASKAGDYKAYVTRLVLLHQMLVYAMKAKQTTDLENVEKLRALLENFRAAYPTEHENNAKHPEHNRKEVEGHKH